jgi:hypothetical protein
MPKVTRKTTRFDAADYLDTEDRQIAYSLALAASPIGARPQAPAS